MADPPPADDPAANRPEPGDPDFIGPVRLVYWHEPEGAFTYPYVQVPVPFGLFRALPRHPAYKWEYYGGRGVLTPRPKLMHCVRPTRGAPLPDDLTEPETFRGDAPAIRPLEPDDWDALPPVMAGAFYTVVPFWQMPDERRERAARECLDRTRTGEDGPLIPEACAIAVAPRGGDGPDAGEPVVLGAALVTLYHPGDPADMLGRHRPARGKLAPPDDWQRRAWGSPHLTWAFVGGMSARHGVGAALLRAACNALAGLGYEELTSTFLMGNESSTLWHWRTGFRLLPGPFSPRAYRRHRDAAANDAADAGGD